MIKTPAELIKTVCKIWRSTNFDVICTHYFKSTSFNRQTDIHL